MKYDNIFFQIPELHIFGPKFRHFCFFAKFCKKTNLTVLISNMTTVFFKFQPKITRFKDFHFWTKLCNKTNSRTLIWNMKITFSNSIPKIHKLGVLGPKFKDLNFAPNFAVWRPWLPIWQWLFRILVRKYPNKTIFCPKCKYFLILHEASHI